MRIKIRPPRLRRFQGKPHPVPDRRARAALGQQHRMGNALKAPRSRDRDLWCASLHPKLPDFHTSPRHDDPRRRFSRAYPPGLHRRRRGFHLQHPRLPRALPPRAEHRQACYQRKSAEDRPYPSLQVPLPHIIRAAGIEPARPLRDNGFSCHFGFRRLDLCEFVVWTLPSSAVGMLLVESLHVLPLRGASLGVASPHQAGVSPNLGSSTSSVAAGALKSFKSVASAVPPRPVIQNTTAAPLDLTARDPHPPQGNRT